MRIQNVGLMRFAGSPNASYLVEAQTQPQTQAQAGDSKDKKIAHLREEVENLITKNIRLTAEIDAKDKIIKDQRAQIKKLESQAESKASSHAVSSYAVSNSEYSKIKTQLEEAMAAANHIYGNCMPHSMDE